MKIAPAVRAEHTYVRYRYTSLSPQGDAFVARFTEAHYEEFMKSWERELNAFLTRPGSR